jgi:hypothetical protein
VETEHLEIVEVSAPAEAEEVTKQSWFKELRENEEHVTAGVGYSGRAALRREQCDVHAVGQQSRVETFVYNRC